MNEEYTDFIEGLRQTTLIVMNLSYRKKTQVQRMKDGKM